MKQALAIAICACGSSPPAPDRPQVVPADAAVDAAPDAGISEALANAPAWVFRYTAPGRQETWTLRFAGGEGLVIVESGHGTTRYTGTASEIDGLTLALISGPNQLSLACKHAQLVVPATCGAKTTRKIGVLDCFHPDFKSPMSFAAAPGVEFVTSDACTGYQTIAR